MAKQCPRCWDKVSPETEICPNCGYDFTRKTAKPVEEAEPVEKKRKVVFPTPKKKEKEGFAAMGVKYKVIFIMTLAWTILAVIGTITNLVYGDMILGVRLLASAVLCGISFMFIKKQVHQLPATFMVLLSGPIAALPLVLASFIVSYMIYTAGRYFNDD